MKCTSSAIAMRVGNAIFYGLIALVALGVSSGKVFAEDEKGHGDEIHISAEVLEEFGVEFEVAGPARLEQSITLAGEIRPNANRLARISPRYEGLITEVMAEVGDQVVVGQTLCKVESDESLSEYELRTLIAGTVIERDVVLGESVDQQRELFSVADLSNVWLDLTVYQRDLHRLDEGQRVDVYLGHDDLVARGKITYISPVLDQATRTGHVRVVLDNRDGHWRVGMFVTASVSVGGFEVPVAVEHDAILEVEGRPVVFVRSDDGAIESREVHTGRSGRDRVEILEGLLAGESYVSRNGFVLKADLGKDRFGDGHGH